MSGEGRPVMRDKPLVSVIMPLYNKRPYVRYAIESVQNQTYANWELIIVDDGSTDGSSEEIPPNDPRIRVFAQENRGPGAARNRGIEKAAGELVTFLDADDYYFRHKLEREADILGKLQWGEWMASSFEYISESDIKLRCFTDIHGKEIGGNVQVFGNALKELTVMGWPVDGLCLTKDLLKRVGSFKEDMRCYEITEFVIRCTLKQPQVVIHPEPLYRVTDVPASTFKSVADRVEGVRQQGESLCRLARAYHEFSDELSAKSRKSLLSYVSMLILSGKRTEARRYLTCHYPYRRCRKWWKMMLGSWMPEWLLEHVRGTKSA